MPTTLNLYGTTTPSPITLTTANKLANATGGTTTTVSNTVGTGTGYSELTAQGSGTWANLGNIGTPTGKGFLWDVTTLEGQQIIAGTWTPGVRVKISRTATITADLYMRAYKRSSGGTYTLIGSMHTTSSSITGALTNFAPIAAVLSAVSFATGDKLYIDVWANVTNNTLGFVTMTIDMALSSTTTGIANQVEMDTPGYSVVSTSTKNLSSRLRVSALQLGKNLLTRLRVSAFGQAGAANISTRLLLTIPARYLVTRMQMSALQSGKNLSMRLVFLGTTRSLSTRLILGALQSGLNLGARLLFGHNATGAPLASDTFQRANQSGWGTASDGVSTWSVVAGSAATLTVSSNQGTATGITARTFLALGGGTTTNGEVLAQVSASSTSYGALSMFLRGSGVPGSYSCYHARISMSDTANGFGIVKVVNGVTTNLVTTSFTASINTLYWIRFRALGSNLYARMWAVGSGEPTTWTLTTTDTSIIGVGSYGVGANTTVSGDVVTFDNVSVSDAVIRRDLISRLIIQNAPSSLYVYDSFLRTNTSFSNWGLASDGHSYTVTGSGALSIVGNQGLMVSVGSDTHANLASFITSTDSELLISFSVNSQGDSAGLELRYTPANGTSSYQLLWYQSSLNLSGQVNGSRTALASSPFPISTNTFYWLRFRAQGTTLSGRMWADGSVEPSSWSVTAVDATLVSGGFAILGNAASGSLGILFDNFMASAINGITGANIPLRLFLKIVNNMDVVQRLRLAAYGFAGQTDLALRLLIRAPAVYLATRLVLLGNQNSSNVTNRVRVSAYGTGGTTTTVYDLYPFGGIIPITTNRGIPPSLSIRLRFLPIQQRNLPTRLVLLPFVFPITQASYTLAFQPSSPLPALQNPYGTLPLSQMMLRSAWMSQEKGSTPTLFSPYTIGTVNLDMPHTATAPRTQDGLIVPKGSSFVLTFDNVSTATGIVLGQYATGLPLGTGTPTTMSFVLYGGEVVTGSVYLQATLLTATFWQLWVQMATPIRVNRWTVSSQFN